MSRASEKQVSKELRAMSDLLHQLQRIDQRFCDFNSLYQETKKFLESKGLTNVSELDKRGTAELVDHLMNAAGILVS